MKSFVAIALGILLIAGCKPEAQQGTDAKRTYQNLYRLTGAGLSDFIPISITEAPVRVSVESTSPMVTLSLRDDNDEPSKRVDIQPGKEYAVSDFIAKPGKYKIQVYAPDGWTVSLDIQKGR